MSVDNFGPMLPEIFLALFAMAALMFGAFMGKDRVAVTITWATVAAFVLLAAWIGLGMHGDKMAYDGMFLNDAFARFA